MLAAFHALDLVAAAGGTDDGRRVITAWL